MTVCKHCHAFQVFKDKCWYYWDGKSACSQFKQHAGSEPGFVSIEQVERALAEKP